MNASVTTMSLSLPGGVLGTPRLPSSPMIQYLALGAWVITLGGQEMCQLKTPHMCMCCFLYRSISKLYQQPQALRRHLGFASKNKL